MQLSPDQPARIDLAAFAQRLASLGEVSVNAYLLRLTVGNYRITLFADGRAIIAGTSDLAEARTVWARYVGM